MNELERLIVGVEHQLLGLPEVAAYKRHAAVRQLHVRLDRQRQILKRDRLVAQDLPPALTQIRTKLKQHAGGDRQFVKVLGAVLDHGLAAVEAACAEALEAGVASGDVILTVLARRRQPATPPSIHEILDVMDELKLYGMRASFDEIAGKGLARRDEIYPPIAR
jgi:hypothetical protein